MSSLRITTQQRKTIIQTLENGFGPAVKSTLKDDKQDTHHLTAVEIYQWIANPGLEIRRQQVGLPDPIRFCQSLNHIHFTPKNFSCCSFFVAYSSSEPATN